ncbi:MAG: DUF6456 domain-containing protein [Hyphomicrobiales bacterium]
MSDVDIHLIKALRSLAARSRSSTAKGEGLNKSREDRVILDKLLARALIKQNKTDNYSLTKEGVRFLKRAQCDEGVAYQRQHQNVVIGEIDAGEKVSINQNESPLARLYHRRGKSGVRLLSKLQYEAGESLRRDFEASKFTPKLGMTLGPKVDGGGYNDAVSTAMTGSLAAKKRIECAISSVGPELGALLLDVCCYLKGLELVERERQWPVRSAKVVLGVALNQLAVHYGLTNRAIV